MEEKPRVEDGDHEEFDDPVHVFYEPEKWIYRVPNKLRNVNAAAYTPQLLSIGPFHHGKLELQDMEIHKATYCQNFCQQRSLRTIDELRLFIENRRHDILDCYAGAIINLTNRELVELILVDACFIIEVFIIYFEQNENNYHLLRSPWLRKCIEQDLILFENQLPYSLLQDLYDFAMPPSLFNSPAEAQRPQEHASPHTGHKQQYCSSCFHHCLHCFCKTRRRDHLVEIANAEHVHPFLNLTCEFYKECSKGKKLRNGVTPKHFTDLVRYFLCPEEEMTWLDNRRIKTIFDASKLKEAGVNFWPLEVTSFVVKGDESHKYCNFNVACFTSMDMKLTQFRVNDQTECVIRNVMALEQFLYPESAYICQYFLLMEKLVKTVEDVNLLVESGVIVTKLGCNDWVVNLINTLCLEIMDDNCCFGGVCSQLNRHYGISFWNRHVAILKRVYFKDLWTASSTILGLFVLVFSIIGTMKSLK